MELKDLDEQHEDQVATFKRIQWNLFIANLNCNLRLIPKIKPKQEIEEECKRPGRRSEKITGTMLQNVTGTKKLKIWTQPGLYKRPDPREEQN